MKNKSAFQASFDAAYGKDWKQIIPWTGHKRSSDFDVFIEEVRQALLEPDRNGDSIMSCLINDTDYPYWEGEEKTIDKLALLGIITEREYNYKKGNK